MNKQLLFLTLLISFNFGAFASLDKISKPLIVNNIKIDSSNVALRIFEKNFKSKYNNTDFIYEFKSKESNAWDRFKHWLSDIVNNIFNLSNNEASMNVVEIFLKTLAVLLIIFVIYLIVKAVLNQEGSWIFGKSSDKKIIHYTDIEKNIHQVDFEKLIQETIQSGENRLTIRYYYLWLLKKMASQEVIVWDIEKTNSDYLYEIKNLKIKEEFQYASYLYNYIWYGEFTLDSNTFEKAKTVFINALNTVSNE